jgi:hypothetical protein
MPDVALHLRVATDPTPTIDDLLQSAREAFAQVGIGVQVLSTQRVKLPLQDINVAGDCTSRRALTVSQQALFDTIKLGPKEIVAFFVRSTNAPTSGCSQHPDGKPGAVIASACTKWTLAHELGHLLDLRHVDDPTRLMYRVTNQISANVPILVAKEQARLLISPLLR